MSINNNILDPPGEIVKTKKRLSQRGRDFANAIKSAQARGFVELIELRRVSEPPSDCIVFSLEPQRPQDLKADIRRKETIAVIFRDDDVGCPEVLALRADFPTLPHLNLRHNEFPRSLCLYNQGWAEEKLLWTPTSFLHRIHTWLSTAATGNLHAKDQPLEPLMSNTGCLLIVPNGTLTDPELDSNKPLVPTGYRKSGFQETIFAKAVSDPAQIEKALVTVVLRCRPQPHGVIRKLPRNLAELSGICEKGGLDLVDRLSKIIEGWVLDRPFPNWQASKLLILLILPKTREKGSEVEGVESRGFLTINHTAQEIGGLLGVTGGVGGLPPGYIIGGDRPEPTKLEPVSLAPVEVTEMLGRGRAAALNNKKQDSTERVAIGAGAFGSQVINNFVRAGTGRWVIVDKDVIRPHNAARHLLGGCHSGLNKAEAVSAELNVAIDPHNPAVEAIPADLLNPGEHKTELETALNSAGEIYDFTASISAARYLAEVECPARRISGFVTPSGNGMIILSEDSNRKSPLGWLENLHYRMVLTNRELHESLIPKGEVRTGATCSDISATIGQAEIGTWAGMFCQRIPVITTSPSGTVEIHQNTIEGGVKVFKTTPSPPETIRIGNWKVLFDDWIIDKLAQLRQSKLPNETGGILLGVLDTHRNVCALTDVVPSPSDSEEWPTSYIRGRNGLLQVVRESERRTAGQVSYVGEWHSHPDNATISPSKLDRRAFNELKQQRDEENLPTIMVIIGEHQRIGFVAGNRRAKPVRL